MNDQVEGAEVQAEEVKAPLTRREKLVNRYNLLVKRIESDTAEATNLANTLENFEAIENIREGSVVFVKQGRADTTRYVEATVIATREDEDGSKQYKVQIGEGFDSDVQIVGSAKVFLTAPVAAPVDTAAE